MSSHSPRRAAIEKWKQNLGSNATYNNLIGVFKRAGYQEFADTVRKLVPQISCHLTDYFTDDKLFAALPPSPPPLPQLPVFPEPEPVSSLPLTTAVAAVLIEEEHQQGRRYNDVIQVKSRSY